MNKLSNFMAKKIGKKSQYEEISNTATSAEEDNPLERPEADTALDALVSSPEAAAVPFSSEGEYEVFSVPWYKRVDFPLLLVVALLVVVYALMGERASNRGAQTAYIEDATTATSIPHRPCQILDKNVQVLQTSLGDSSVHWGQISCLVYGKKTNNADNSGSSYLFGNEWDSSSTNNDSGNDPIEYGMPSAQINVNYPSGPVFKDREPIMGFGGAFTEASALNYMSLNDEGRAAVLELLFGRDGLGYSLGRTHINSCDFCVTSYAFDTTDGDFELDDFDDRVQHDVSCGMIQMMLDADTLAKTSWPENQHGVRIMASPWSPPAWMKAPTKEDSPESVHAEKMTNSAEWSCLRDGVGKNSEYAKSWALYIGKFLTAYKNLGLQIFSVTVQNEPEFQAPWEACLFTPDSQGEFVANHLGPHLREFHPDVKILIFDHNKDHAPLWADIIMNQTNVASNYVNGTAVHWYADSTDRLLDGALGSPNMHRLVSIVNNDHARPDHLVFGSEGCHCPSTGYAGGNFKIAWARAERYAHTILSDLAAGSNGWIDWNVILDAVGGPNHLGNMCDASLLAVPYRANGAVNITKQASFEHSGHPFGAVQGDKLTREELNALGYSAKYVDVGVIVQPMYYYMGHISRHVRPGSKAVAAIVDVSRGGPDSRTFRTNGGVAGGGINDLARIGIEVTTWPCEGSTRQEWKFSDEGKLVVFGHDWLGVPTKSCLGRSPDDDLKGLCLSDCSDEEAATLKIKSVEQKKETSSSNAAVNIVVTNSNNTSGENCLVVKPLLNNGGAHGPRGGAQVDVGSCTAQSALWYVDETTGEITSKLFAKDGGDVCLTTGWPFLQVGAFDTTRAMKRKTVVILNEAEEGANFMLSDGGKVFMTSSIPPHSIQTILFD